MQEVLVIKKNVDIVDLKDVNATEKMMVPSTETAKTELKQVWS